MAFDLDKKIVFQVTPVSTAGNKKTGEAVSSEGIDVVANSGPTATAVGVSIGGTNVNANYTVIGDTLTGSYTYEDVDSDNESTPTYSWLRYDGKTIITISGAIGTTYTVTAADVPFQIIFEVTPMALTGALKGSPFRSIGIKTRKLLNDTGITSCGDYASSDSNPDYPVTGSGVHNNRLNCSQQPTVPTQTTNGLDSDGDIIRAGQDALYGRDVTHNDNSDGHAGFSYTKLDSNGNPLVNQTSDYAAQPWACVKDNVTGLIWEVKTLTGPQSSTYTYTWYNPRGNDGGDKGIGDTGPGVGSDNCADVKRCDTDKYRADVNASNGGAGLCGATDWRLPSIAELRSIINYNQTNLSIDTNYFPNTVTSYYWSSSPYAGSNNNFAWDANFDGGFVTYNVKYSARVVRLVRGSQ